MKNTHVNPTIFVQIASYRDAECQWTLRDLFAKASHPERVFVGICWQLAPEDEAGCFQEAYAYPEQVRELRFPVSESKGVCWARAQAQRLYEDEDYVLMIDSHMRFLPGWDEAMIAELATCDSRKPILSAYPPGYTPPDNLAADPRLTVMCLNPPNAQGDIRGRGEVLDRAPERPLRGAFIAAGYLFARGDLVAEVPYDPHMYFNQEEVSLAARFFTHGWDVFHPSRILLYHYYNAPTPAKSTQVTHHQHWNDHKDWQQRQMLARRRLHFMTGYRSDADGEAIAEMERYGLGRERSLLDFALFTGLDLTRFQASAKAYTGQFIEGLDRLRDKPVANPAAQPAQASSTRQNLRPVVPGQFLPPFCLPDPSGRARDLQLYAGRTTVLLLLPRNFPAYRHEFLTAWREGGERLRRHDAHRLFILQGSPTDAGRLKEEYALEEFVLADGDGEVAAMLGADSLDSTPLTVIVDASQRVIARIRQRNAANHMGELQRALASDAAPSEPASITQRHAPVLMLPDAIDEALAEALLSYWKSGRQYAGSIGEGGQTRVVSGKRRTDVNIDDAALQARVDDCLSKTLLPELRKLGADICYRERYKIGCYRDSDQGYYHQHRDTGVPTLAHRRYSLTMPLSEDYEGGTLVFPEYGVQYRVPARTAVAFPSALLHGVTPVTKGERFVMVSFMHGQAEEAFRRQQLLSRGEAYRKGDVEMACETRFGEILLSPYFYTRTGS